MTGRGTAFVGHSGDAGDGARWDGRYRAKERADPAGASGRRPDPPQSLVRMASLLPAGGRAIDLAGGDGGGGLFLARRGLETTVVDVSSVALARAAAFAAADDLPLITVQADLGGAGLATVLAGAGAPAPAAVICFNYLDRILLASLADDLPSGARFMAAIATTTNLERHRRPPERFLLQPGELASLVLGRRRSRLRTLHRREGWADDRHRAELVVEAR